MTGRNIIKNALIEIGVIGAAETPSPEDQSLALSVLQRAVDAKGAERLAIFKLLRTTKTLVSGTRDYTIGSGGDINIVRPAWIDHATAVLDTTLDEPIESPIAVYTDQQWAGLRVKTLDASTIAGIYYDHAMNSASRGVISTYPTVNVGTVRLVLYTPEAVTGFVDVNTAYVYPPGYEDAYHYELAYRLQRPFGKPLDRDLRELRDDAWARVKRANFRLSEMGLDPMFAGFGGFYSIETDGA